MQIHDLRKISYGKIDNKITAKLKICRCCCANHTKNGAFFVSVQNRFNLDISLGLVVI